MTYRVRYRDRENVRARLMVILCHPQYLVVKHGQRTARVGGRDSSSHHRLGVDVCCEIRFGRINIRTVNMLAEFDGGMVTEFAGSAAESLHTISTPALR